jgi:hypothetical protein
MHRHTHTDVIKNYNRIEPKTKNAYQGFFRLTIILVKCDNAKHINFEEMVNFKIIWFILRMTELR